MTTSHDRHVLESSPELATEQRVRDYQYYDIALSLCSICYRRVEGKIVFQGENVFLLKRCPEHGAQRVLLADDVAYYRRAREIFLKPSEMPRRFHTAVHYGCPYDCGLCSDHEQHTCVALLEVNDQCNLACPICYASSGPRRHEQRSLSTLEAMLDAIVESEGEPDVVQISGGEPTIHPDFFAILDAARRRPIRHLMVNTNGVRIAREPDFAERLAEYMPGFEIYLQFDSFDRETLLDLRGADLRSVRQQAIERLNALGLSTTLVVTLKKGRNDKEVGRLIDWALEQPAVRGVTLQPIQSAGRVDGFDPATDRLTLTEVRRLAAEQSEHFTAADILPVPCHPDCIAMAYALKVDGRVQALSGLVDPDLLIDGGRNTIVFERDERLRHRLFDALSTRHSPQSSVNSLRELLCCLPRVSLPEGLDYRNLFRLLIVQFLDAHSFDVRSVKKSCVHVVRPDGRMIPLDTYNLFYRDELEQQRLQPLRRGHRR